jgi:murein DD-endopeptidase MepM/ murein hydrolase activator NlpD
MPSVHRPSTRALTAAALLTAACILAVVLWASSAVPARAASTGALQQQIAAGQGQISGLSGAVNAASGRVTQLGSAIAGLEHRIAGIQAALDAKRAQLLALRVQLNSARSRLAVLEAAQTRAQTVLGRRLVNTYETSRPDLVSVVLESTGFQNLLERLSFARRIQNQDARVVSQVRASRRAVAAQATRLGALELRQQTITAQILTQRNKLATARLGIVRQQLAAAQTRSTKAGQLSQVRGHVAALQRELAKLRAPVVPAVTSSGATSGSVAPSQIGSSGGFTFPMPKADASPPGTWSLDQGVDISAPGGTPELAVCSGTIVLHGIGGFGPWAPVLHCDSPVGGYSYVYYGHAGPANQLPVGSHVGAGQVMSEVGPGIVGISTGPHIEIGFSDSSGTPIGSGSASTMMSLLQSSY